MAEHVALVHLSLPATHAVARWLLAVTSVCSTMLSTLQEVWLCTNHTMVVAQLSSAHISRTKAA